MNPDGLTSFNSSANMTPKLNLQKTRDAKDVLPAVERLLAQKELDGFNENYTEEDLIQELRNDKRANINIYSVSNSGTMNAQELQRILDQNESKDSDQAINWPTKLAISFEQGLSPKSNRSLPKKQLVKGMYLSKMIKKPQKPQKLNDENEISLMSRRLS